LQGRLQEVEGLLAVAAAGKADAEAQAASAAVALGQAEAELAARSEAAARADAEADAQIAQLQRELAAAGEALAESQAAAVVASESSGEKEASLQGRLQEVEGLLANVDERHIAEQQQLKQSHEETLTRQRRTVQTLKNELEESCKLNEQFKLNQKQHDDARVVQLQQEMTAQSAAAATANAEANAKISQLQRELAAAGVAMTASRALQGRLKEVEGLLAAAASGKADAEAKAASAASALAQAEAELAARSEAAARADAEADAQIAQLQRELAAARESLADMQVAAVAASASSGEREAALQGQLQEAIPATISKTASSVFGAILSKLKSDSILSAETQVVHLERDERGFGLLLDLVHFDGMGVKAAATREGSPAAISGMIEAGHRLVMIDDADVTDLNAEQVLEVLKQKTTVKLCLKTPAAAQAYFESKSASAKPAPASPPSSELQEPPPPAVSKAASVMFGKLKSASSFFSSSFPASPASAAIPVSVDFKMLVSLTSAPAQPFSLFVPSHSAAHIRSASRSTRDLASLASACPTFPPAPPTTSG